jgi:hypothetical protein
VRLAGTHVEVNEISAPLFSVKPDRLLLQLPTNFISGQPAYLNVSSVSLAAPPMLLPIETAAPAIVGATRTAGALVIYLTGLGVTDPPLQEGRPAPATTLLRTLVKPSVSVGGQPATVLFSGLTPGLAGLYQIKVLLPGDAPPSFEIIVEAAGRSHSSSSPEVCSARLLEASLASCGGYISSVAAAAAVEDAPE